MLSVKELLSGRVKRVSFVNRFSSFNVSRYENVAEHSYFVSLYCMLIANDIEESVNYERLMQSALLHDIDESMTGDIIRMIKYDSEAMKQVVDRISLNSVRVILGDLNADKLIESFIYSKSNSIEGDILKVADMLSVSSYLLSELERGNTTFFISSAPLNIRYLKELNVSPQLNQYIDDAILLMEEYLELQKT